LGKDNQADEVKNELKSEYMINFYSSAGS
jgi:hypothetical protein